MGETADRYRRLRAVFDEALRTPRAARPRYLARACADEPALLPQLQRLLDAHEQASSFLERPVTLSFPATLVDDDFCGTDRFTVLRRLGAGGMGVVYEVEDRARGEVVALKALRHTTPAGLYRLKNEFRSLAGVAHPNFVCLYELVVEDARPFYTMELVNGVNFVEYVRGAGRASLSIDRLTSALRQLIDGVSALHRLGKLHRDIKPSNVLVTLDGRVVILDFGLMTELFPADGLAEQMIGGTPAYVAPEIGSGVPPSEAGDWYGVGATLYEALTGEVPFRGPLLEVLLLKRESDPPSPSDLHANVPPDLSSICMGLMCRDRARRLSGRDALSRLRLGSMTVSAVNRAEGPLAEAPFVGRTRELGLLDDAYARIASGRPAAAYVCGPSGIGKSALIRSFLHRLAAHHDVVVLSGRCYEHESVPYKALDGVVDSLSRYLVSLPAAESVLPHDVVALPRLFPVMRRIPAIAEACREREPADVEPLVLRRRASEALREILVRIAARQRLVIAIDDLQWADVDGVLLLEELLRPPNAPPVLTVVSFRSEELAGIPFLQRLRERGEQGAWTPITLDPMPDAEAGELVAALLSADSPLSDEEKLRITREADGSPFVLEQLARYAGVAYAGVARIEPSRAPTFGEVLDTRVRKLSSEARGFLETLAICGRPMAPELVCAACGVAGARQSLVAMLRSSQLIRSSGSSDRVEPYHDRIREVLTARMAPEAVRRTHGAMVEALVARSSDDCEALFEHYQGAGDGDNASIQAGLAAAKAATALAFDRAAFFYRQALALTPSWPDASARKEGLAHALANAGRPAEAAEAYLEAATGVEHPARVELQRRGAEQFLIGGHIDRGLDLIRAMLAGMDVRMPRRPRGAMLSLLWRRARLRWRGLRFVPRQADAIDADALLRVDTCWSATTGLLLVDLIGAADLSMRHLLMALDAGEPFRVARAMAIESAVRASDQSGGRLGEQLADQSRALARSIGTPPAIALSLLADGMMAMAAGEWKKASVISNRALAMLRDKCVGFWWEMNIAQNLVVWGLMYQGELRELSRLVPSLLADARRRDNLYIATELCTRSNFAWLAADDPDGGERETIESISRWSHKGFHRQHYSARLARVQTALYRGDAEGAWRLLTEQESSLRRSLILNRIQVLLVEAHYLRSRCALAMAARHHESRRFLSVARAGARRIARARRPWSDPIALLLEAAIAYLQGSTPLAVRLLHDAVERFERADMNLYAAVARRRIGALQHDAAGRDMQQQGDEWMAAQCIRNPMCMTRMLAPGFPDAA